MKLTEYADLSACNSLRVPAACRALAEVDHWYELAGVLEDRRFRDLPRLLLGDGTNVLFRHDFPGLVVRIANDGIRVLDDDGDRVFVRVAAGENWHGLVQWAARRGLWGIENLALIPGTVGAAPVQNIGAYGVELRETLVSVKAFDHHAREWREFNCADCRFDYRTSRFKEDPESRAWITEVVLELRRRGEPRIEYPGLAEALELQDLEEPPGPAEIAATVAAIRRQKLPEPRETPNVGSFFKNPVVALEVAEALRARFPDLPAFEVPGGRKLSAGWLIEQCGFKGCKRGTAGVYDKHALVLVNHGGATGEAVWRLALEIQAVVAERFGIMLEPEPLIV